MGPKKMYPTLHMSASHRSRCWPNLLGNSVNLGVVPLERPNHIIGPFPVSPELVNPRVSDSQVMISAIATMRIIPGPKPSVSSTAG